MKIAIRIIAVALLALPGCASRTMPSADIETGAPANEFVPPATEEFTLSNGIKVFFIADNELPLIRGTLYLRGGSLWEDEKSTGSLAALGALMRSGGAGDKTADELDTALERISGFVATGFGLEFGTASFGCLSEDIDTELSLFSDVLFRPRFQEDRLSLWKGQMMETIRRRRDSPDSVSAIAFNQLIYGDTPLGRVMTRENVHAITTEDLRTLHDRFIRPDGAILAVSGAIDRETLRAALEKYLGEWPARGEELSPPRIPIESAPPGIYFLKLPFTQATVFAGHEGPGRLPPDYAAIDGFNALFGAGGEFSSLLTKVVRSDLGLVYSVAGGIYTAFPAGKNAVMLQTKSASTGDAIAASLGVLGRMMKGQFEPDDLADAKRSIVNSYVFKFDTTDGVVQRRAVLSLLNYPETYDDTYTEKINRLTGESVREVAARRWDLGSLIVLVVGDDDALRSLQAKIAQGVPSLQPLPLKEVHFEETLIR